MVPFAAMGQAEVECARLGFEVDTYVARGLGHSIDEAGLRLGGDFLARMLGAAG
jgi:phospholipase/carboxylesterase